jgi:succinoglycan biosynthesis protein ExoM
VSSISVCICTFRRPDLLRRLLGELARQETNGRFTYSLVVVDNDAGRSAQPVVTAFAATSSLPIVYCVEPRQNIALARNLAVAHATGNYIAFIDDDEFPSPNWLHHLLETCLVTGAAGVLGPVRPYFEAPPPVWLVRGRFCERPEHPTGTVIDWRECRTGNVLLRRTLLEGVAEPFAAEFGTGGEDVDFFRRMAACGWVFVWCNEAVAHELVPPSRWTRRYMLRRALLRGRNNLKLRGTRVRALLTSAVAVPLYSVVIPGALILGQHVFMKYSIKFCDHLGRLLTLLGINPVKDRQM